MYVFSNILGTHMGLSLFLQIEGRDIPIVHRVLKVHEKDDGSVKFLTKGDNNRVSQLLFIAQHLNS